MKEYEANVFRRIFSLTGYVNSIGMVNTKTTAVRVIPAIGCKEGDVLDFGGLLGYAPILPVSTFSPSVFVNRGGRIPAPLQALKN